MNKKVQNETLVQYDVESLPSEIEIVYGRHQKEVAYAQENEAVHGIDLSRTPLEVFVADVDLLPNEEYALKRRFGFGASDSSILVGVNPYKTLNELIQEKARNELTEEEKLVGQQIAVRKGNDLEPMIIMKYDKFFGTHTFKPKDMYRYRDYPYLKINFDGVTEINKEYIPVEIKVCTARGERHYNPSKAIFIEGMGFINPLPEDVTMRNMSISEKAAFYGIPPYYYTQLQMEMKALEAPWGHLTVLFEKSWTLHTWFVWRDVKVQNDVIVSGFRTWDRVCALNPERINQV